MTMTKAKLTNKKNLKINLKTIIGLVFIIFTNALKIISVFTATGVTTTWDVDAAGAKIPGSEQILPPSLFEAILPDYHSILVVVLSLIIETALVMWLLKKYKAVKFYPLAAGVFTGALWLWSSAVNPFVGLLPVAVGAAVFAAALGVHRLIVKRKA